MIHFTNSTYTKEKKKLDILSLKIKYRETIFYLFFGVITTIINIVCYYICFSRFGFNNTLSNFIAWLVAVLVAFYTNKKWVYESKIFSKGIMACEFFTFTASRITTGLLDIICMYILVEKLYFFSIYAKVIVNVVVIILNYIAGRYLVFKKIDR